MLEFPAAFRGVGMRIPVYLAAAAVVASRCVAAIVPLPAEVQTVALPGFTVQSPGPSWYAQTSFDGQSRDSSARGIFRAQFFASPAAKDNPLFSMLGLGHRSTAVIDIAGAVLPIPSNDPKAVADALMDAMKKGIEHEAATDTRIHYKSSDVGETSVNGAICVRWEASSEDRGVPHHEGDAYVLTMHRLMCSDPEFPAYTARVDYSLRLEPGDHDFNPDAAGIAVVNSLKFDHLGYRVAVVPVGPMPQMLAESDGAIWVAYGYQNGRVARIDPRTNAVAATIPVGRVPVGITADASGVWVANAMDDTVQRLDPKTNAVAATIHVPSKPEMILSGFGSVWVTANGAGSVVRIDPATGAVAEIAGTVAQPAGMAITGDAVYVTDYASGRILRIDPGSNAVTGAFEGALDSNYMIADGRFLWANSQTREPAVVRIDPSAAGIHTRFTGVDYEPTGMAIWNGKLWVANWAGSSLSVIDPAGAPTNRVFFPVGPAPFGVLAARNSLWVSVLGLQGALRLDPD